MFTVFAALLTSPNAAQIQNWVTVKMKVFANGFCRKYQ
jgi:hypothetical protein